MKKKGILLFVACSSLTLGGCSIQEKFNILNINEAVINVVKRDNIIPNSKDPSYSFSCYEICQNDNNQTLNVFGKLSDESYNSYLKLSYDNIDFANYDFSDRVDSFANIADIINNYSDYNMQNIAVDNFNNFETIFNVEIPQKDSKGHDIEDYDVLSIDGFNYNEKTNQIEFNSSVVADYKWDEPYTTVTLIGGHPYTMINYATHHNYKNYTFDVKYNISKEDYMNYNSNSKELIGVLENYIKNDLTNEYTITETEKTFTSYVKNAKSDTKNQYEKDDGMSLQ